MPDRPTSRDFVTPPRLRDRVTERLRRARASDVARLPDPDGTKRTRGGLIVPESTDARQAKRDRERKVEAAQAELRNRLRRDPTAAELAWCAKFGEAPDRHTRRALAGHARVNAAGERVPSRVAATADIDWSEQTRAGRARAAARRRLRPTKAERDALNLDDRAA